MNIKQFQVGLAKLLEKKAEVCKAIELIEKNEGIINGFLIDLNVFLYDSDLATYGSDLSNEIEDMQDTPFGYFINDFYELPECAVDSNHGELEDFFGIAKDCKDFDFDGGK